MKPSYEEYRKHTHDEREGEWPRIEFNARQTGRTTRMMEAAKRASYDGNEVHIVVKDQRYATTLKNLFRTHEWPMSVFFHTPQTYPFEMHRRAEFESRACRKVFISHEAIEWHPVYSSILLELHRFDLPPDQKLF